MAQYITPCSDCLGENICKRRLHNVQALDSKVLRADDLPGDRLAVKVFCEEYSCKYAATSRLAGSCNSSVTPKNRVWHTGGIPCEQCRFRSLCSVDFAKQEAFCLAATKELDGVVKVSCSCYELFGDRE